jgi:hypothetical protein
MALLILVRVKSVAEFPKIKSRCQSQGGGVSEKDFSLQALPFFFPAAK